MKKTGYFAVLLIAVVLIGLVYMICSGGFAKQRNWPEHPVDLPMVQAAEHFFEVRLSPPARYSFAIMKPGVIQHLDRRYTYDVVPAELLNGVLFQGIHRPPADTRISIIVKQPTDVYFFFHHRVDGGYGEIFRTLAGWERRPAAPQYDVLNQRGHGLEMIMYHLHSEAGTIEIPATTSDRACFNIVFQRVNGELAEAAE